MIPMRVCVSCPNKVGGRARYCAQCARDRENARKRRKYVRGAFEDVVFALHGERCAYCLKPGTRETLKLDHVEPLAKGGANDASNLVPACEPCNSAKRDKPLLVHLLDQRSVKSLASSVGAE